jgi:hypothetical protein
MGKKKNPRQSGKARREAFLRKIKQIKRKQQRGDRRKSEQ